MQGDTTGPVWRRSMSEGFGVCMNTSCMCVLFQYSLTIFSFAFLSGFPLQVPFVCVFDFAK